MYKVAAIHHNNDIVDLIKNVLEFSKDKAPQEIIKNTTKGLQMKSLFDSKFTFLIKVYTN